MSRIRRSVLYMPGDSLKKITKATQLDVDSIVMDLEDGVALNNKQAGRETIVEAFNTLDFGRRERLVRINPFDSPFAQDDLDKTIGVKPDGYVIPKVESAADLQQVDTFLEQAEQTNGWEVGSIKLLAIIETARGVFHLPQIVTASKRLSALMFGSEDLAGDMGALRTPEGMEILYARSAVVLAAAAYKLDAIDTVYPDFRDHEGLKRESLFAKQLGYCGKMAIHPGQVPIMNDVFVPTPEEIDYAQRLIAANDQHQSEGTGAFAFEGKMVDMPMIRSAQKVIQQATQAGILQA